MRILPLLVFIPAPVAPVAAQSPLATSPLPDAAPQRGISFPAPDFRLSPSAVIQDERSFPGTGQSLSPLYYKIAWNLNAPRPERSSTCDVIRGYRVAGVDPETGAHKFIAVTACQLTQFQLRDAVSSQER